MTSNTIRDLQYFINKVCSIVATSMNRSFDEKLSREHFVIRIKTINIDGIWGTHPYNHNLVSFFCLSHIISIHEEVELSLDNPEHVEMINEFKEKTGKEIKSDIEYNPLNVLPEKPKEVESFEEGDSTFVDIASLERLAEQSRKTFDAQDMLGKNQF
jgi:hypothetical protein